MWPFTKSAGSHCGAAEGKGCLSTHFNVIALRVPGKYFIVCQHKLKVQSYWNGVIPHSEALQKMSFCLSFDLKFLGTWVMGQL